VARGPRGVRATPSATGWNGPQPATRGRPAAQPLASRSAGRPGRRHDPVRATTTGPARVGRSGGAPNRLRWDDRMPESVVGYDGVLVISPSFPRSLPLQAEPGGPGIVPRTRNGDRERSVSRAGGHDRWACTGCLASFRSRLNVRSWSRPPPTCPGRGRVRLQAGAPRSRGPVLPTRRQAASAHGQCRIPGWGRAGWRC
jgi:hypothetical protein